MKTLFIKKSLCAKISKLQVFRVLNPEKFKPKIKVLTFVFIPLFMLFSFSAEAQIIRTLKDVGVKIFMLGFKVDKMESGAERSFKKNIFGETEILNERGDVVATIKKNFYGKDVVIDAHGNETLYEPDFMGDSYTVTAAGGRDRSKISKDIFGNYVEVFDNGSKKIYKKNIFGEIEVEDESGRKLGTFTDRFTARLIFERDR